MKSKIFIVTIITIIILISCQKLDREIVPGLDEKTFYTNYDYAVYRVNALYNSLPSGFLYVGEVAMMASATDEAEHTLETAIVQKFNTGNWNPTDNPDNVWSTYYSTIRNANHYLENCSNINNDIYKLNPDAAAQSVYNTRLATLKRIKYEARFLRAFSHFELVKRFGGIPIMTKTISLEEDYANIARNTLDQCIKFIVDECDSCAVNLPLTYGSSDLGRITKGAAMALKSRVLLYAASDLFNTPSWATGYAHPELISLTGDRVTKWAAAATAAKELIDLAGTGYTLSSYSNLFGANNYKENEIILAKRAGATNSFEIANVPIGYDLGQSGTNPSQNLVDAFETINGKTIAEDPVYDPQNPYANRDPRLEKVILTNNTIYKGRPVECWTGGLDGEGTARATKTGYYLKKYVNESLNLTEDRTAVHTWIIIRLPEIWLNYAEALNESDPGNPDIKTYIDKVRQRADVMMPVLPDGLSQAEIRNRIRNERRVEFAFEDHRYWDLKRWMVGSDYLNVPLKGVKITKTGDATFNYQVQNVENRIFEPKMYLYPIPQSELLVATKLVQNPLW